MNSSSLDMNLVCAHVGALQAGNNERGRAPARPFHPEPKVAKMLGKIGVFSEVSGNQTFKLVAQVAVAGGFRAEDFKNILNGLVVSPRKLVFVKRDTP